MSLLLLLLPVSCNFTASMIPSFGYPSLYPLFSSLTHSSGIIYQFGGTDNFDFSNDLKSFNLTSRLWNDLLPSSEELPAQRKNSASFVYQNKLFIFGGQSKSRILNDLWSFNLRSKIWKKLDQSGEIPSARLKFSFVIHNELMFLYGGETCCENDPLVYRFNITLLHWSVIGSIPVNKSRSGSALFWHQDILNIWGGSTNDSDIIQVFPSTGLIKTLKIIGNPPSPRYSFPYLLNENSLLILPGNSYPSGENVLSCFQIYLTSLTSNQIDCNVKYLYTAFIQVEKLIFLFGAVDSESIINQLVQGRVSNGFQIKELSPSVVYPKPRTGHALQKSGKYLWVFGGCSDEKYYQDCWKFDVLAETWEKIASSMDEPAARCGHQSVALYGNIFYLFGGRNSEKFFNDLFVFNAVSNKWTELTHSSSISPRSSACMTLVYPVIMIHGGKYKETVLNDLWIYIINDNNFEEIKTIGEKPALFDHNCFIDPDSSSFIVFSGTNINNQPSPYYYILTGEKWTIFEKNEKIRLSSSAFYIINNQLVIIGGNQYSEAQNKIIKLKDSEFLEIASIPYFLSGNKLTYIGKSFYSFGGSLTNGKIILGNKGSSLLLKISLQEFSCDLGFSGKNCEICPAGTFSDHFDSDHCEPCKPGTYSKDEGTWFDFECLPCPSGTFTNRSGSKFCLDCPIQQDCKFKTVKPRYSTHQETNQDIQPVAYKENSEKADYYSFVIGVSVASVIGFLVIFFLLASRRRVFILIDFYKDQHERKYFEEASATALGGLFSYIYLSLLVFFICSPVIFYSIANISEVKSLVPLFTLNGQEFNAKNFHIKIKLFDYGGTCVSNGECEGKIEGNVSGLQFGKTEHFCSDQGNNCCIDYFFQDVSFQESGVIDLLVVDKAIFATGVQTSLSVSSSMPGEYNESFIQMLAQAPEGFVLNGLEPTVFDVNVVPSVRVIKVFFTDSSKWKSNTTGYHITFAENYSLGSLSDSENINTFLTFKVSIRFQRSLNAFVINRNTNVDILTLLSGLLGSIAGIFDTLGSILSITEKLSGKIKSKINKKLMILRIFKKRIEISDSKVVPLDRIENNSKSEFGDAPTKLF